MTWTDADRWVMVPGGVILALGCMASLIHVSVGNQNKWVVGQTVLLLACMACFALYGWSLGFEKKDWQSDRE